LRKRYIPVLLLLLFSTCIFYTGDRSRAVHPVAVEDNSEIVYVKTKGKNDAVNIYQIGYGAIPVWCDVDQKYQPLLTEHDMAQKMYAVCYSGSKPAASELNFNSNSATNIKTSKTKSNFFIEEQFNPFAKVYAFSVFIAPNNYKEFLVFYFNLYKNFCQKNGVSCCMTGDGEDFVFDFILEEPENVKQFYNELDSVVSFITNNHKVYKGTESLYNMFSSLIYDKCSFNRWYYDAVAVGLLSPESFMNVETWKGFENKSSFMHIKRVGVKLVDYQKTPSDEKAWLDSSLRTLGQRF
jgi:hypothetical protein